MKKISLLDCTLRDGGYCNDWKFGHDNIVDIVSNLQLSKVDVIECGYITEKGNYEEGLTLFNSIEAVNQILPDEKNNYVCMINKGDYNICNLSGNNINNKVCGIRYAFHKPDINDIENDLKLILDKGYELYIQPMVISDYSEADIMQLIAIANKFIPKYIYIVDSFGVLDEFEIEKICILLNSNLKENIGIGIHFHNNMQTCFANTKAFLKNIEAARNVMIDASVFGMGRGAGNLNQEIIMEYLNKMYGMDYFIRPILDIYDNSLSEFYLLNKWGYSFSTYLAAVHNCHPSYAQYLDKKNTLSVCEMNSIFENISLDHKNHFNKDYIEMLYVKFLSSNHIANIKSAEDELGRILKGNKILLISSGKSSCDEFESINNFITNNAPLIISVNFHYELYNTDYEFYSNIKRFRKNKKKDAHVKYILTSNIESPIEHYSIDYASHINVDKNISDNSVLILLHYLKEYGINDVYLAGFDGYSGNLENNYAKRSMIIDINEEEAKDKNEKIKKYIDEIAKEINIKFVTTSKYLMGAKDEKNNSD